MKLVVSSAVESLPTNTSIVVVSITQSRAAACTRLVPIAAVLMAVVVRDGVAVNDRDLADGGGQLNGSFPPGATSPNSRSATAAPPWVPGYQIAGGAGGARTHDRRIMRSTAPCGVRASCTDDTDHRTSGTRNAGIWRAGPRAVPRSDCSAPDNLLAGNAPTNRLQEVRPRARCALAARIARIIALTALTPLAISGAPVHEPVHVARQAESPTVTQRSDRGPCGPPAPASHTGLLI